MLRSRDRELGLGDERGYGGPVGDERVGAVEERERRKGMT